MEKDKLDSIKKQCMDKWGEKDERIEQFEKNFDKWSEFSTDEEAQICLNLLEKFNYYSKANVNIELRNLHKQLLENYNFDSNHTAYTHINNRDGKINSSLEYLLEYKSINEIKHNLCRIDISCIDDSLYEYVDNVVLIDDCIGSGQTMCDFLKRYRKNLIGKNIYLILIYAVKEWANKLQKFANDNGFNLKILCENIKEGAFLIDTSKKEKFLTLSKNRQIPKDYILGRTNVEALVAFYNNTPNNTLGIFWYETQKNVPLFQRRKDELVWNKDKRKQQNYKNVGINL